jgi:hypothetical protein
LRAFNYTSRTLIESTEIFLLQGTVSGNDVRVEGRAKALVNGVQTNITFKVVKLGSVITFEIRDAANTCTVLAGGTGEAGRATFDLTTTPTAQLSSPRSPPTPARLNYRSNEKLTGIHAVGWLAKTRH